MARGKNAWEQLHADVTGCMRCSRLRTYCLAVAAEKRKAFAHWNYWGKPAPGFGDPEARIWLMGLAPAAHGANRTGRVFTGDLSGDFLFAALWRAGLANQPTSVSMDDGLTLHDCYISPAVRCAPPDNKPLPTEAARCAPFLDREWALLQNKRVIMALGKIAWDAALGMALRNGADPAARKVKFGHGAEADLGVGVTLLGSYHVSPRNTNTGRLTAKMFDATLARAKNLAGSSRRAQAA